MAGASDSGLDDTALLATAALEPGRGGRGAFRAGLDALNRAAMEAAAREGAVVGGGAAAPARDGDDAVRPIPGDASRTLLRPRTLALAAIPLAGGGSVGDRPAKGVADVDVPSPGPTSGAGVAGRVVMPPELPPGVDRRWTLCCRRARTERVRSARVSEGVASRLAEAVAPAEGLPGEGEGDRTRSGLGELGGGDEGGSSGEGPGYEGDEKGGRGGYPNVLRESSVRRAVEQPRKADTYAKATCDRPRRRRFDEPPRILSALVKLSGPRADPARARVPAGVAAARVGAAATREAGGGAAAPCASAKRRIRISCCHVSVAALMGGRNTKQR